MPWHIHGGGALVNTADTLGSRQSARCPPPGDSPSWRACWFLPRLTVAFYKVPTHCPPRICYHEATWWLGAAWFTFFRSTDGRNYTSKGGTVAHLCPGIYHSCRSLPGDGFREKRIQTRPWNWRLRKGAWKAPRKQPGVSGEAEFRELTDRALMRCRAIPGLPGIFSHSSKSWKSPVVPEIVRIKLNKITCTCCLYGEKKSTQTATTLRMAPGT